MICRNCGSNIPDAAQSCPDCGEVLKPEKEIVPKRGKKELKREVAKELFIFFNNFVGYAFSADALQNRLEEIITDRKTREHGSEHLQKILDQMIQNGVIKSNLHNNETHYHISDAHQEEPYKTIYSNEKPKKPTIRALKTKSNDKDSKTALICFGIIGGIFILVGILAVIGPFASGSDLPIGITLVIIGIIIMGIISRGECCGDFCYDCCDPCNW